MKIVYIVTLADLGGAQKYVYQLAQDTMGIVAAGGNNNYLKKLCLEKKIKFYSLRFLKREVNPLYDILAIIELFFLLIKTNPDIVHLNSLKAGVLGSIVAKILNKKVVYTAHGLSGLDHKNLLIKKIYILIETIACFFRDRIICVSKFDEMLILKYKICKPDQLVLIQNGIESIDFFDAVTAKKKLQLQQNKFLIGCIARLTPIKGVDILIKAYSRLPKYTMNKTQLIIIGDGVDREQLNKQLVNLGLTNNILFLGEIRNSAKFLKAFDLIVIPSRFEGLPFILLEAIQSNTPIISSNVGGISHFLKKYPFLFDREDYLTMAKFLNDFTENILIRKRSQNWLSTNVKILSDKEMIKQTKLVYKNIMLNN